MASSPVPKDGRILESQVETPPDEKSHSNVIQITNLRGSTPSDLNESLSRVRRLRARPECVDQTA